MSQAVKLAISSLLLAFALGAAAQTGYQEVSLSSSGTIAGTVKWSGALPRLTAYPITKDPAICDPESHKTRDLERLIVGPQGGVANTVVFLRNIHSGKTMELPEPRRSLDQKRCRYEPHILLVPERNSQDEEFRRNPSYHSHDWSSHLQSAFPVSKPGYYAAHAIGRSGRSQVQRRARLDER